MYLIKKRLVTSLAVSLLQKARNTNLIHKITENDVEMELRTHTQTHKLQTERAAVE